MDKPDERLPKLENQYRNKYSLYDKLCDEIVIQLEAILSQAKISLAVPIESRVKSWESILDNTQRYQVVPESLKEISDLAGVRIILIFKRDVDSVCKIIERTFKILKKEDKTKKLGEDKFGYGSIHYDLQIPKGWHNVPTMAELKELQVELQVRTACQHIWAAASHVLQYKKEKDVPTSLLRSINLVSAQLETVDSQFDIVLRKRNNYLKKMKKPSKTKDLNTDSLRRILDELLPKQNKREPEAYSSLLEDLRAFDIMTADKLQNIIKKHWEAIKISETRRLDARRKMVKSEELTLGHRAKERLERGVVLTHVGLTRVALVKEFGKMFSIYWRKKINKKRNK